jgi:hypothetical protein
MEDAPVIVASASTEPAAIEERFNKWFDGAWAPIYLKTPGLKGIDRYKNLAPGIDSPVYLNMYHHQNINTLKKFGEDRDRKAVIQDLQTWPNEMFLVRACQLVRSFRNPEFSQGKISDTFVAEAPVLHIEGYQVPAAAMTKYADWFARWASRLYIPLLIKGTGIKVFNYYRLLDYQLPHWENYQFLETEFPSVISLSYFDDVRAFDIFKTSLEYAAFKRSLEIELSSAVKTIWGAEYQLFKSYRP